ncbi:RraA family protein [Consotaella aegiceratis]|uniref:RraA family protein n=1 Tax=Consotaella aegiceratis TaxID=3097961 RepID=UPI002F429F3D
MTRSSGEIADCSSRLKKLYTAAVYDILDEMGLPNQCMDLGIRPLDRAMKIAGPAFTVATTNDPRTDAEYDYDEVAKLTFFRRMYQGCVVLVATAGDRKTGHWGELMSASAKAKGAAGVVIDGGIRDGGQLLEMADWSVFSRYLSPIESRLRTRISRIEGPVVVSGTLSAYIRVEPGDWIFGDMDGVLVIPDGLLDEVLSKAEEVERLETRTRQEVMEGADVADVFAKYGRL